MSSLGYVRCADDVFRRAVKGSVTVKAMGIPNNFGIDWRVAWRNNNGERFYCCLDDVSIARNIVQGGGSADGTVRKALGLPA